VFALGTETPTLVEVFISHYRGLALTVRARNVDRRRIGALAAVFRGWYHTSA